MSEIRVNNITNRDGSTGTTVAGIPVVDSTSHFVVPTGRTGQRYVDGGENIVRDGLVLHLDAKYSYPSSVGIGTTTSGATASPGSSVDGEPYTWYDMKSGAAGGLSGGVGFSGADGGSLVFDGVDDFVGHPSTPGLESLSSMTISSWMQLTGDSDCFLRKDNSTFLVEFCSNSTTGAGLGTHPLWFVNTSVGNYYIISQEKIEKNTWVNITATWDQNISDSSRAKIYINAGLTTSIAVSGLSAGRGPIIPSVPSSDHANQFVIGNFQTETFKGKVAQVTIYDRPLTAAEVLQNYNALKGRFGL